MRDIGRGEEIGISIKISTLIAKVQSLPNQQNISTIMDFYSYMEEEGSSENHKINNLKVVLDFAQYLGQESFHDISRREQIVSYLRAYPKTPPLL
jgi:hypothetical protein